MEFRQYMHIERFGNDEVQGIELGECYVFPKLDGTNASVWSDGGLIQAGSRKRQLSLENDNAGFYAWVMSEDGKRVRDFLHTYPYVYLYGEWLVPHSLKTYREDAWRKFYIFDVWYEPGNCYHPYGVYQPHLEEFGLDYIAPLCTMKNATYDNLLVELENNKYLISDGKGSGEGIVIKNYNYQNRFGRTVWAKMITNQFKEKHSKVMPTNKTMKQMVEVEICNKYVSEHLINKVYAKIVTENEGWNSRYIPQLLSTVYYDLVNEDLWNIIKKMRNPTINFKTLATLTTMKIKETRPELF